MHKRIPPADLGFAGGIFIVEKGFMPVASCFLQLLEEEGEGCIADDIEEDNPGG